MNKTLYMYNSNPAKFHDGACRVLRELNAGTLGIGERTVCRAGVVREEILHLRLNPVDRGALAVCSPWGHKELDTTERLTNTHTKLHRGRGQGVCAFPWGKTWLQRRSREAGGTEPHA